MKKSHIFVRLYYLKWAEIWDSNPCVTEPQSAVLTASPIPACLLNIFRIPNIHLKIKLFIHKFTHFTHISSDAYEKL